MPTDNTPIIRRLLVLMTEQAKATAETNALLVQLLAMPAVTVPEADAGSDLPWATGT